MDTTATGQQMSERQRALMPQIAEMAEKLSEYSMGYLAGAIAERIAKEEKKGGEDGGERPE